MRGIGRFLGLMKGGGTLPCDLFHDACGVPAPVATSFAGGSYLNPDINA